MADWQDTGHAELANQGRVPLPDKVPGKHRWVTVAAYVVSDEQAAIGMMPNASVPVILDHENRLDVEIGCYDCELPWGAVHEQPCTEDAGPMTVAVGVSDPTTFSLPDVQPVGLGETDDATKAIIVDSVGTVVMAVSREADRGDPGAVPELRLALSLVGKQNQTRVDTHHMFLADDWVVGTLMAQLVFYSAPMGEGVQKAFDDRIAELENLMEESDVTEDGAAAGDGGHDPTALDDEGQHESSDGEGGVPDSEPGTAEVRDPASGQGDPS